MTDLKPEDLVPRLLDHAALVRLMDKQTNAAGGIGQTREATAKLLEAAASAIDSLLADRARMEKALRAADEALTQFAAFEDDARDIMGNTNFEIVQMRRAEVRQALGASQ